jgi:hypothetical protein
MVSAADKSDDEVDRTQYSLPPIAKRANEGVTSVQFLKALDEFGDANRLTGADLMFVAECRNDGDVLSLYLRPCPEIELRASDVQNFIKFASSGGSPESAARQYIDELTAAAHDDAHRLFSVVSAKLNGATEQEIERRLCPILAKALRNADDPLHWYALVRLVAPAYLIQTATNVPFLRSRGMADVVEKVLATTANEVAHARRVVENSHRNNRENATRPRTKKWQKSIVIQDMRRARRHNSTYLEWLGGVLNEGRPGADFELKTDNSGHIIFVDPDGGRYPINEAAMSSTWWADAGKNL